jgi:hypothetical protein
MEFIKAEVAKEEKERALRLSELEAKRVVKAKDVKKKDDKKGPQKKGKEVEVINLYIYVPM